MNNYDAEVYDPTSHAYKVNMVQGTITGGQATITTVGNVTLNPSPNFVGIVTVTNKDRTITGNVTLDDGSKTQIVSSDGARVVDVDSNNSLAATLRTAGGDPLDDDVNLQVTLAAGTAWPDPKTFIGLVTVVQASSARTITGNLTLSDSKGFIGLVTVGGGFVTTYPQIWNGSSFQAFDNTKYFGLATVDIGSANGVAIKGNVTLSDSKGFIGLVTAWSRNAGTTKTLVHLPANLGNNSLLTVAVPSTNQKINVTQMILNSNITTEIAIKSGVTYLTGNASIGVTIYPGGGFVMNGSPDSPTWISQPSGAMVIEKRDTGGTVSKIGGHVIYFDE